MSTIRPRPARPGDAAGVALLHNAYDRAFGVESDESAEDILDWWRELDLERDTWLLEDDGGVTAFAFAEEPREGVATVDACVGRGVPRPEDVLSDLLELAEARARERGASRAEATIAAADAAGARVLGGRAYELARRYDRMRIDLSAPPPPPEWPPPLAPSPFDPERDAAEFHAALTEIFADEWSFRPEPFGRWRERVLAGPAYDPALWLAVRDGGEIAAVLVCEPRRFGVAWVRQLGVRRPWRGRGLGLALLRHAFGEFWRRGERSVGLGVDSASPTGATALYTRAGMRTDASWLFHSKTLAPGARAAAG